MRGTRGLVYASVQRGEPAGSAVEQHWAQGVVLTPDLVLVPDPPEAEDDVLHGLHLLVTAPGSRRGERVAVRRLEMVLLDDRGVCAALRLAEPVPAPKPPAQPSTPEPLVKALEAGGSVWPVFGALVPDGSGPGTEPGRFLDGLPGGRPDVPEDLRLRLTRLSTVGDVAWSICRWVPWCQPGGPP